MQKKQKLFLFDNCRYYTYRLQGYALRKIDGSPVPWTCEIQDTQHVMYMKKQNRFSSHPGGKVSMPKTTGDF